MNSSEYKEPTSEDIKNLNTKKAKYVFQEGKNGKQNSILVYDLDELGDYVLGSDGKRKVKRIYSADQLPLEISS